MLATVARCHRCGSGPSAGPHQLLQLGNADGRLVLIDEHRTVDEAMGPAFRRPVAVADQATCRPLGVEADPHHGILARTRNASSDACSYPFVAQRGGLRVEPDGEVLG